MTKLTSDLSVGGGGAETEEFHLRGRLHHFLFLHEGPENLITTETNTFHVLC